MNLNVFALLCGIGYLVVLCVTAEDGQKPVVRLTNDPKIEAQCKKRRQLQQSVKRGFKIEGVVSDLDECKINCLVTNLKTGKRHKIDNLARDNFDPCRDGQGCLNGKCIAKNEVALKACHALYKGDTMIAEPESTDNTNCKAKCRIKDVNELQTTGKPFYAEGTKCNSKIFVGYECQSGVCSNKVTTTIEIN